MTEHDDDAERASDPLRSTDGVDLDPQTTAFLQEQLSGLAFLRADGPSTPPMPDDVWDRLSEAFASEAASRGHLSDSAAATARSRSTRWAGGLVAASVAILAVGVGVTALRGDSGGGAVVAGEQPVTMSVSAAASAGANAHSDAELATGALAAPRTLSFAGMIPPTLRLVDSKTDYTADGLRDQVADVMSRMGVAPTTATVAQAVSPASPAPAAAMGDVPAQGFTATAERLRDCITKLTQAAQSTAVLVDRATYEGQEAGVVVSPDYPRDGTGTPPTDVLEVSVVDPDCDLTMRVWMHLTR